MNAAEGPAPRARSGVLLYAVAVAVLALDQLTKALIVLAYQVGDSVPVVGSVLFFTRRTNTGGAFSVLQDSPVLLSVISAAVLLLIVTAGPRFAGSVPGALCALGLVAGGAAGNLLDRIRLGHVVDFIDLRVWPVFNVADIAITVGAALLLISALRAERR